MPDQPPPAGDISPSHEPLAVAFSPARSPDDLSTHTRALAPGRSVLRAGHRHVKGGLPLPCDIVFDRDVAVVLRDGTTIYVDIFRPADAGDLPAIVAWSPYGKQGSSLELDDFPLRAGVPRKALSGLQVFEGPDPAYWCHHGYAVVNADARGVGHSEGDIHFWGAQEGQDGHDLVEWIATQEWSNGKVGLTGNSWLGIAQWFIAAERPPHLAAIAPWEATSDVYREDVMRGGIPNVGFNTMIRDGFAGPGRVEDIPQMVRTHPLMNSYWVDKVPRFEKIDVPAYVTASWTNIQHTHGTLEGFRRIASPDKWLRVHNTMEWPDYYTPRYRDDLRCFFDHYLRGVPGDWKSRPRVRLSVLDPGGHDDVDRPEEKWPPARARHERFYLDAGTGTLTPRPRDRESLARYRSDDGKGHASFTYTFQQDTELVGHPNLHLWVEARGADDMDLFVQIQKLNRRGTLLKKATIPFHPAVLALAGAAHRVGVQQAGMLFFSGPNGRLRVSRRQTDPDRSTPSEPYLTHRHPQPLAEGDIVPVDIGIWPVGMRWRAGERLRVVVAGHNLNPVPLKGVDPPDVRNRGEHLIHTGGRYDSHLLIPVLG